MFLLDSLHESLSRKVVMNITKCNLISDKQKCHQKSLVAWKEQFENNYSPFVDMFFGQFHIQITCENCKNVSHKFDCFNTLKGVFNENHYPTLIECLEADLNDETLENYECDKCKPNKTIATKITKIWKLPQNLILVLKRFTYDGKKINTPIKNIEEPIHLESLFSEYSPNKINSNHFIFRSMVDHHGSISGGHYTAQAKHRINISWFVYDDTSVHDIDNYSIGSSSYILFLEKQ